MKNFTSVVKLSNIAFISMLLLTASSIIAEAMIVEPNEEWIKSQRDQAISHIQKGDYHQADAIVTALAANHPGSDRAGNCIWPIAAQYLRSGEHNRARQLCEMALVTWPNHSEYKHTVSKLAEISLRDAGFDNAVAVTKALIEKYPENKNMIRDYLRREAAHFSRYGHTSQAQKMSQAFLESSAGAESDIWDQAGVVSSYLILSDTLKAEAAVTCLLSGFKGDKDFAEVVNWIAAEYFKSCNPAKAIELYQLVLRQSPSGLSKHPTSYFQLIAHKGLALIYENLGDTAKLDGEVQIIERDYRQERGFEEAVFEIAEGCFLRAQETLQGNDPNQADTELSRAIAVWQRNIDQFANPRRRCKANYYLGMSFQWREDYLKAAQAFAVAYQQDPAFVYADYCLFAQGHCFELLMEEGKIPQADAMTMIVTNYRELISKFPDSGYAKEAQRRLDGNL